MARKRAASAFARASSSPKVTDSAVSLTAVESGAAFATFPTSA